MTAEQALQQAQAQGLTLQRADNKTGYKSVSMLLGRPKPYQAQVWCSTGTVSLGTFATAEEAALCVALSPEGQAQAARRAAAALPRTELTKEQVLQQAQAEGITLRKADSKSGYANVSVLSVSPLRNKPYLAQVYHNGHAMNLGTFATAEEAALCVARSPEGQAQAARREAKVPRRSGAAALTRWTLLTRQAEGLALRKADSKSGYADVTVHPGRAKPYRAKVSRTLGTFATAEEAALCVARGPRSLEWQEAAERAAAVALPRTQLAREQQARDEIIGAVALEIIYQAAEAAAIELGAEVAAEVMAGIALGL